MKTTSTLIRLQNYSTLFFVNAAILNTNSQLVNKFTNDATVYNLYICNIEMLPHSQQANRENPTSNWAPRSMCVCVCAFDCYQYAIVFVCLVSTERFSQLHGNVSECVSSDCLHTSKSNKSIHYFTMSQWFYSNLMRTRWLLPYLFTHLIRFSNQSRMMWKKC